MENLFRPSKWLVLFCGVFILLYAVLQYVSTARLKQEAAMVGRGIFTWAWPGDNWRSQAADISTEIVQKNPNDAIVKVKAKQTVSFFPPGDNFNEQAARSETLDATATLTFYKRSEKNTDYWMLGKVQFP